MYLAWGMFTSDNITIIMTEEKYYIITTDETLYIYLFRLAGYVESLATKLGFEGPQMNSAQLQMTRTVVATNLV